MATPIRIAGVKSAGDFVLQVAFTNGKTFAVNLRESVYRLKALRPLRDPRAFARADVGEGGFSLVWPGELDMGADRIYETALEQNGRMTWLRRPGDDKTTRWDSAKYLKTERDIVQYINACLAEAQDDPAFLAHALGVVARALETLSS